MDQKWDCQSEHFRLYVRQGGLQMNIPDSCARCLYDKQTRRTDDAAYLAEVKAMLDSRSESDTSPLMVLRFNQAYERRFGKLQSYADVKKRFNDLALSMEALVRDRIDSSPDPLAAALAYARVGNYVDFGALKDVSEEKFLELLGSPELYESDRKAYASFIAQCRHAGNFLLLADNCGEIVFDKLLLEQLGKRYPGMKLSVLVRGAEALNDVTLDDAEYVGLDKVAHLITNGEPVAGTIYERLPPEAKEAVDHADIILAKGQGNYESFAPSGKHAFYLLLCKCELFTGRFQVPKLTGVFVEEDMSGKYGDGAILKGR